jgi:glycosyltransferase involved in cell wall biosynthesis
MKKKGKLDKQEKHPFVSICMPTFNRRPFIPIIIKCFENQTYPKDKIEWIIVDDGTDKIEDLVAHIPQVKYFKYDKKMSLGKKRNITNEKARGDIIIYMDDDDYYPPERISHAVTTLQKNPKALCAGSSTMYMYFKHIDKMYEFGPYGPNFLSESDAFVCKCDTGYYGLRCELGPACLPGSTCSKGGSCIAILTDFGIYQKCLCPVGNNQVIKDKC